MKLSSLSKNQHLFSLVITTLLFVTFTSCNFNTKSTEKVEDKDTQTELKNDQSIILTAIPERAVKRADQLKPTFTKDEFQHVIKREQWHYDVDGFPDKYFVMHYNYNEAGKRTFEEISQYDLKGNLVTRNTNKSEYNAQNQRTINEYLSVGPKLDTLLHNFTELKYDQEGRILLTETLDGNHVILISISREYKADGDGVIEHIKRYTDGELNQDRTIDYDNSGTIINQEDIQ